MDVGGEGNFHLIARLVRRYDNECEIVKHAIPSQVLAKFILNRMDWCLKNLLNKVLSILSYLSYYVVQS